MPRARAAKMVEAGDRHSGEPNILIILVDDMTSSMRPAVARELTRAEPIQRQPTWAEQVATLLRSISYETQRAWSCGIWTACG